MSDSKMIALLIDADNFSSPAWINEAIQTLEMTCGDIAIRRAYGSAEKLKGLADVLRSRVIRPFVNLPLPKNTTDMSLAVDAMELACLTPRPKLIVIASGDLDFVPLVVRLRERGIRVVCVSERSKMAQDAIPAYDQIIYVGEDQVDSPVTGKAAPVPVASIGTTPEKPVENIRAVKVTVPKAVTGKRGPAKKAAQKTTATKAVITPKQILAVLPSVQNGQWLPLGEVAKILHDKRLLAKSATSTKLFRKFPDHFELMPASKPNKVRVIKS
ncbi:NYN domain-containing protein [Candidatus Propionivibrio aalborgensis]|nr:NYN domain-containing protein [Candidatus Propionivibrio aalborgensis]